MNRLERRKLEVREKILAAAFDLFLGQGVAATTIEEICKRADVANRTFFNHFATRQDMIRALAERRLVNLHDVVFDRSDEAIPARLVGVFDDIAAALAKSGTVTLELALANVPMVAVYKVTPAEAFIARRVIQTSSIILPNIILGENVIPEFLQDDFTPEKLAPVLRDVLADTPLRQRQIEAFKRLEGIMSTAGKRPSERAAEVVIKTFQLAHK